MKAKVIETGEFIDKVCGGLISYWDSDNREEYI